MNAGPLHFNLTRIVPAGRKYHGVRGYAEVIEAVEWGLAQLGHGVTTTTNSVADAGVNIVFGAQMLAPDAVASLPPDTFVYHLEQIAGLEPAELSPAYAAIARRLRVWDYSLANIATWRRLAPAREPLHVPVGCAPTWARILKPAVQDLDVLFYGMASQARAQAFFDAAELGLRTAWLCGVYGPERDALISRAKVVLNVNRYDRSRVFEIARVAYLLANAKAVVSDVFPDSEIEPELREAVVFAPAQSMAAECQRLVDDDAARLELERRGPLVIGRRPMDEILRRALAATI